MYIYLYLYIHRDRSITHLGEIKQAANSVAILRDFPRKTEHSLFGLVLTMTPAYWTPCWGSKLPFSPDCDQPNSRGLYTHSKDSLLRVGWPSLHVSPAYRRLRHTLYEGEEPNEDHNLKMTSLTWKAMFLRMHLNNLKHQCHHCFMVSNWCTHRVTLQILWLTCITFNLKMCLSSPSLKRTRLVSIPCARSAYFAFGASVSRMHVDR